MSHATITSPRAPAGAGSHDAWRPAGVAAGVLPAAFTPARTAALTQIREVSITEVGSAVALGVLLDTLLVRTVLVPASVLTIGERVWWPSRRWTAGRDDERAAVAGLPGHASGLAAPSEPQPRANGKAVAFTVDITRPASTDDTGSDA